MGSGPRSRLSGIILSIVSLVVGLGAIAFAITLIVTNDWRVLDSLRDPRGEAPRGPVLFSEFAVGAIFITAGIVGLLNPQRPTKQGD